MVPKKPSLNNIHARKMCNQSSHEETLNRHFQKCDSISDGTADPPVLFSSCSLVFYFLVQVLGQSQKDPTLPLSGY